MATGWAGDGAVQDQIDATVSDAVQRARRQLKKGPGLTHCEACDAPIPAARRKAVPGVRLCVNCQEAQDAEPAPPFITGAEAKTVSFANPWNAR